MDNIGRIVKSEDYDYRKLRDLIYAIKGRYPFVSLNTIGKSVMGKEIHALTIGKSDRYALYVGAFHGMERLTAVLLLRFVEQLCSALESDGEIAGMPARKSMYGRGVMIIPCINPDGCDISLLGAAGCGNLAPQIYKICGGDFSKWNANARGVDINHNFDAGWEVLRQMEKKAGIYGPSPRRYGGPRPNSEPETVALTQLCEKLPVRLVMAYHSQGEEIYWHYGDNTPEISQRMVRVLAASSGYAAEHPTGIAAHGGFKDWFIKRFGKPGFTIEVGRGENPLPMSMLDSIYNRIEEMMMIGCIM